MRKSNLSLFVLITFLIIVIIFSIVLFNDNLNKKISKNTYAQLINISSSIADSVAAHIEDERNTLAIIAQHFSSMGDLEGDLTKSLLKNLRTKRQYHNIEIFLPGDKKITTDGMHETTQANPSSIALALQGESSITGPVNCDGITTLNFSTPIFNEDTVIGCIYTSYNIDRIKTALNRDNEDYSMFIATGKGDIVSGAENSEIFANGCNILEYIKETSIHNERYTTVKTQLENLESNYNIIEDSNRDKTFISFSHTGLNDLFVFTLTSHDELTKHIVDIEIEVFTLFLTIFICIFILIYYIVIQNSKARKESLVFADNLKKSENIYRIATSQLESVIVDIDYTTNKLVRMGNYKKMFGDNTPETDDWLAIKEQFVFPEDYEIYDSAIESLTPENPTGKVEYRHKNTSLNEYFWCRMSMTRFFDKNKPTRMLCSIVDIHYEKMQTEQLRAKASTDNLTDLHNKTAAQFLIADAISTSTAGATHAIISADIDNFKNINDSFGHLFGDEILKEIAFNIKNLFRRTDILGRFGGDEFVLFIKDIPDIEFIKHKANELVNSFNKNIMVGNIEHRISLSIGIAIYPTDGKSYEELFIKADQSLYAAKRAGKNMFCIYGDSVFQSNMD